MLEPLKKLMLAGLGVAFFTREKVEETIEKLVKNDQLSREQGKKLIAELAEKGKTGQEELIKKVNGEISSLLNKYQPIQRAEFEELRDLVEMLEKKLKPSCTKTDSETKADAEAETKTEPKGQTEGVKNE